MSIMQKIKEIEDEVRACAGRFVTHMLACPLRLPLAQRALLSAQTVCLPACLVVPSPQMARTQKNKATSGHLGMLKVSDSAFQVPGLTRTCVCLPIQCTGSHGVG